MEVAALSYRCRPTADNIMVPMQAASNLPVILLALGSFAARAGNHCASWTVAWLLGMMGVSTTGNGFAIIAILILWDLATKRWKELGIGVLFFALACYLYFNSFANPGSQTFRSSPADITCNALVMLGAIFKFGSAPLGAAIASGLILGVWSMLTCIYAIRKRHYFVAAALLFIGGSIAMAGFARAGWGNEYMLQPRYMIYPSITLTICVAYTLNYTDRPAAKPCLLLLCSLFNLTAWWNGVRAVINS